MLSTLQYKQFTGLECNLPLNCVYIRQQNHWFTYNETMTVESVTQAVSNLALQFGEEDADPGAMVSHLAHLHAETLMYSNLFFFSLA